MSVIIISGIPGAGKTLFATYLMKRKFRLENNWLKRKVLKKPIYNNIFTNYPVKLDKKRFSRKVSKEDFYNYRKFLPDSDFVFDEFQAVFGDSMDYKVFPKVTADIFAFHRHFGANNIYLISQHPARVMKKPRDIACEYWKIKNFRKFLGIGLINYTIYYNFEDYGKSTKKYKDREIEFDYKNKFVLFFTKRIFSSYDTKYMKTIVENKPYIESEEYTNTLLSLDDIYYNFNIKDTE